MQKPLKYSSHGVIASPPARNASLARRTGEVVFLHYPEQGLPSEGGTSSRQGLPGWPTGEVVFTLRPSQGSVPRKDPQEPRSDREEDQYHPDELGKPFDDTPVNALEIAEIRKRFDRELKGRFDLVRSGFWKSGIPGAEGLVITPAKDARGETRAISITPVHTDAQGKPILRMPTLQLSKNGRLVGEIPEEIDDSLFREQILQATLDIQKMLNVGEYPAFESNITILAGTVEKGKGGDAEWDGIDHARDPRRVAFLQQQEGALFMFVQTQQGAPVGQHVYAFETFLYVDSEFTDYAAYFFDLTEPLTLTREDIPDPRIPAARSMRGWCSSHGLRRISGKPVSRRGTRAQNGSSTRATGSNVSSRRLTNGRSHGKHRNSRFIRHPPHRGAGDLCYADAGTRYATTR